MDRGTPSRGDVKVNKVMTVTEFDAAGEAD